MATTPPLVLPRDVTPRQVDNHDVPPGAFLRAQGGPLQGRDFNRAGRVWRETYPLLSVRDVNHQKLLSRLRWFRARAKFFWADHPLLPGSGIAIGGTGEENLIRDAAMDTDTDGDGVVDGFEKTGPFGGGAVTYTLDGGRGAQKLELTRGTGDAVAGLISAVLRVFPGDTVTASYAFETENGTGTAEGAIQILFRDESGLTTGVENSTDVQSVGGFTRHEVTGTAPADTAFVEISPRGKIGGSDGDTGTVWIRNARLLRASSDPATYANPHVNGGSQTGDSLDTAGWPASTTNVLRAGDVFRIGGSGETQAAAETDEVFRSFEVLADVDSDGSGNATIPIDPPIFSGLSVPGGAALRFSGMRMRVGMPRANLPQPSQMVDKYAGISTTFVETL